MRLTVNTLVSATVGSLVDRSAPARTPAVAVRNMLVVRMSSDIPDDEKVSNSNVEVVTVEGGFVNSSMSIWKNVPDDSSLPSTAVIIPEALLPVHDVITIELGSTMLHVKAPLGIDVVEGMVISK